MALTDNCPQCLAGPVEPHTAEPVGGSIAAGYACPSCRYAWSCSWDSASLPPGLLNAAATVRRNRNVTTT
jgi:transposase-like protein